MKKDFDFYEFAGIIVPGVVVIMGFVITISWGNQGQLKKFAELSAGSLGLGIILAYAAGHLVQSVGNLIENIWWWIEGGRPTDWVRSGKHKIVSAQQHALLQDRVRQIIDDNSFNLDSSVGKNQWHAITRQLYAAVEAANKAKRVDVFNGNYGLCRGIATSLLTILCFLSIIDWGEWKVMLILAALFFIAIYRMRRFGIHYGRELFVQCLQTMAASEKKEAE
jgi:hypothetical protein